MAIQLPFAVRPLALESIASGNELANRPASSLGYLDYVNMVWQSSGNTNLWARGQFEGGASKDVDFISLISANALAGTTIRVRLGTSQAEVDGTAPYDSGALTYIDPAITREDGLYHSHLELSAVETCSWWRIDIGGHTGDFQASGLVIGEKVTPTRFYDKDFELGVEPLDEIEISRNGVVGKVDGIVLRTLLFRLSWLTEAEYFATFAPLAEALGNSGISFWCFDPESTVYRQQKTYLGYFGRAPFARGGVKPRTYAQEYQIRSII
ncbi:hypothetical protein [Novosphingobium sp. KN65.2]|uniref:hypothetical protein n=1 Tax=Novosphingobium sp. KN65.2 TaxID=1478134 RepID=UPI0005E65F14|nr:hypothetical protein [Novosphingobium sp. KN65.2]CDO34027.1 hypothetical protein SPHV1_100061 [Novosphingobium sp. KN65.2]